MGPTILSVSIPISNPVSQDLHPSPSSAQSFLSILTSSPHAFLQPPPSLHAAALVLAKQYLDPLAESTSEAQAQRLHDARKKRKRNDVDSSISADVLRMKQVYTQGFEISQIWEQARRIVDASRHEVERGLSEVLSNDKNGPTAAGGKVVRVDQMIDDPSPGYDKDRLEVKASEKDEAEISEDSENQDGDEAEREASLGEGSIGYATDDEAVEAEDVSSNLDPGVDDTSESESPRETFMPDKNGLNDGFFSIDEFNKQSEFLEQQDARGEQTNGAVSDEEEIYWDADPAAIAPARKSGQSAQSEENQESGEEDDGPTFGNTNLNAPDSSDLASDADEVEMEDMDNMNNTNDIKYADFFAPPPRKATKSTRRRALPKTQPPPREAVSRPTDDDIQRTISAVRRDIFDDDDPAPDDNDNNSAASDDPSTLRPSNHSNHQTRQAQLAAEIRRLEAANVAKRDWTLSGEARAADRPLNSLLEEDLEFERAGKPVPVITNEVSEDIEALIKRRILAREFDEVVRRRPGNLATGPDVRRGRFELDDSKPQQSLAELYEVDHLKAANPDTYVDASMEKQNADAAAAEQLWRDISAQLDALCSFHYRPKPPQAMVRVVADVPTISIEDARPSAGADMGGESMLAPQEVYVPGEGRGKEERQREVVLKGGAVVGRAEMGGDERKRRRRREKERIRKGGGGGDGGGGAVEGKSGPGVIDGKDGNKRKRQGEREMVGALKRGGVKVIDRKGEVRDAHGRKVEPMPKGGGRTGAGAGGWKL